MTITDTHVYFWRGPFSNWYHVNFIDPITHIRYSNSEQCFMWYKANFFRDTQYANRIIQTSDPAAVKQIGRLIREYDENAWNCVKLGFMTYACLLKYSQNNDLQKILLETGDKTLVEASPLDTVWGIGVSEEDAIAGKPWRGSNLLGVALGEVRHTLRLDKEPIIR